MDAQSKKAVFFQNKWDFQIFLVPEILCLVPEILNLSKNAIFCTLYFWENCFGKKMWNFNVFFISMPWELIYLKPLLKSSFFLLNSSLKQNIRIWIAFKTIEYSMILFSFFFAKFFQFIESIKYSLRHSFLGFLKDKNWIYLIVCSF